MILLEVKLIPFKYEDIRAKKAVVFKSVFALTFLGEWV